MKRILFIFAIIIFTMTACKTDGDDDPQVPHYIITGSGAEFTATRDGLAVGTANQPIQNIIDFIKINAAGSNCSIQFGNNTTLDIGAADILLDGGFERDDWGTITFQGKIRNSIEDGQTITLNNNVSIISKADIENTEDKSTAIYSVDGGDITINGGTIRAVGFSISQNSNGTITVNGGTVRATGTGGCAIYLSGGTGNAKINGGTISAPDGYAVYKESFVPAKLPLVPAPLL